MVVRKIIFAMLTLMLLFGFVSKVTCETNVTSDADEQLRRDFEEYGNSQCNCNDPNHFTRRMTNVRAVKGPILISGLGELIGCKVVELTELSSHSITKVNEYLEDDKNEVRFIDVCDVRSRYNKLPLHNGE